MPALKLSPHDIDVLQKIKDPESAPAPIFVDASLPRDPHISDPSDYECATTSERQIILRFQSLESQLAACQPGKEEVKLKLQAEYSACVTQLDDLITRFPRYASAYNNEAQALRRQYGDSVLLKTAEPLPSLVDSGAMADEVLAAAGTTVLRALDTAIALLSPVSPFTPISSQAAKTLSQAYTQRGALFHATAKQMDSNHSAKLRLDKGWSQVDLEEMASRDFAMGGRYGNEIARGLAVATNPTAKLCGNIVREAMRMEFEGLSA